MGAIVYLAGPISGCNDVQKTRWRNEFKALAKGTLQCEDPSAWPTKGDVLTREMLAMARAEIVVADMWKESIGTTIGIVRACANGKPVVLIDPNDLGNFMLRALLPAENIVRSVAEAKERAERIAERLRPIARVLSKKGKDAPFSQARIVRSIRAACSQAGVVDHVFPTILCAHVAQALQRRPPAERIETAEIREVIFAEIAELEGSRLFPQEIKRAAAKVRAEWERKERSKAGERELERLRAEIAARDEALAAKDAVVAEKEKEIERLKRELQGLRFHKDDLAGFLKPGDEPPETVPRNVREAVEQARAVFRAFLSFHKTALSSAADSPYREPEKAFRALRLLAKFGEARREAIQAKRAVQPLAEWFERNKRDAPWLSYAANESESTMNECGAERTIVVDGLKVPLERHLKIGVGNANEHLRIYFEMLDGDDHIVVGHVGRHLGTATRRK